MILDYLISLLLIIGTFFMILGSIGVLRMPDIYTRLHALTKSSTMGLTSLLVACALTLSEMEITIKVIFAIFFHFLTNPVGAHMIIRAAYYHLHCPFWKNTIADEWKN